MSLEIAQDVLHKLQNRELIPSHKRTIEEDIPKWENDPKFRARQESFGIQKPDRMDYIYQDITNRIQELQRVTAQDASPDQLMAVLNEIRKAVQEWMQDEQMTPDRTEKVSNLLKRVAIAWGVEKPDRD